MLTLVSSVLMAGQILIQPRDENGQLVALDEDAIKVSVLEGEGARAVVERKIDQEGKPFLLTFVPGDAPATYKFRISADLEPGAGISVVDEDVDYVATAQKAVTLGASLLGYVKKSDLPPAV